MTLLDRVRAAQKCSVGWCEFDRVEGALFCGASGNGHLTDYWQHRLRKLDDGTYIGIVGPRARLTAKDYSGEMVA